MPTSQTSSETALIVDGTLRYSSSPSSPAVFDGLSLSIQPGTRLAIIGPNGCGKSSLLKVLLRFVPLTTGKIVLELSDQDFLSAIIQDYRQLLVLGESVLTNVVLPYGGDRHPSLSPDDVVQGTRATLKAVGYQFPETATVGQLSGGQQQALVLARSLAFKPRFFLWDEPLSAIDFAKRGLLYRQILVCWSQTQASGVIITHDADEAVILGDRVVVFDAAMNILFDGMTPVSDGLRDRDWLCSKQVRSFQDEIRNAMFGDHSKGEV